jgi:uncharacterized lipoprotein YbaY
MAPVCVPSSWSWMPDTDVALIPTDSDTSRWPFARSRPGGRGREDAGRSTTRRRTRSAASADGAPVCARGRNDAMKLHIAWMVLVFMALPIDAAPAEQVTGTATYLPRVALPPNALFEARVEDVPRADAPSVTIGSVRIMGPGNPPIAFAIDIDPQRVDERHRYSVRATITVDGRLAFTTDRAHPVLTQGHGRDVELVLRETGGARPATGARSLRARPVAGELHRRSAVRGLPGAALPAQSVRRPVVLPQRGPARAEEGRQLQRFVDAVERSPHPDAAWRTGAAADVPRD